jgi:hypothetical protein
LITGCFEIFFTTIGIKELHASKGLQRAQVKKSKDEDLDSKLFLYVRRQGHNQPPDLEI